MPVPPVDPEAPQGAVKRAVRRAVANSAGRWVGMNLARQLDRWLLERTNGRLAATSGVFPVGYMTTTGARSGHLRSTPINYFTEDDDVILIASNFGQDKHPAWYHNLRTHPEFTIASRGRDGTYVAAEVQDAAERDRLYALAVKIFPGYAGYEDRVQGKRDIRVMRCAPKTGA